MILARVKGLPKKISNSPKLFVIANTGRYRSDFFEEISAPPFVHSDKSELFQNFTALRRTPRSFCFSKTGDSHHYPGIEKSPRSEDLRLFSWLGWRDSNPRMHGPKLGASPSLATLEQRVTEVDQFLRDRRRHWLVGAVAVSAAVKDTSGDDVDLAA